MRNYKIAVAGTGYVGLSIATLLSQHHQVTAVDIVPEKVELINNRKSPIQDDYIEKYLAEKAVVDGMEQVLRTGDVITIAAGCKHTVEAITALDMIEVQLGDEISVADKIKFPMV